MKKILLLLAVFMQAMSMSVSARDFLIKTEWGQSELNSLLPKFEDGTHVFSGCTTVAAAQVINYYGFLPSYDFSFAIDVVPTGVNSFPEGTEELGMSTGARYIGTYHCPGMPTTPDSLMAAIFYSQANLIETSGTSTSPYSLYGCFSNHYSYDIEAYISDEYDNADEVVFCKKVTTEEQKEIVKKAIAAGHPVIVNGNGHSFIIDGYDAETDEFHFNLGWGTGHNFWGTYRSWADGKYSIFIPTPNKNKLTMPEVKDEDHIAFHIRNINSGEEKIGYVKFNAAFGKNLVFFGNDACIDVYPGTYEIWFVMKDGSIFAPALPYNKKMFADQQENLLAYNFLNHPAVLTIDDTDSIGYYLQTATYYDTQMGNIELAFSEIVPPEAYLKADIKVVCNGETYQLTNHNGKMRTDNFEVKAGSLVDYILYYNGIPYGKTTNSYYQGESTIGGSNIIYIQPSIASTSLIANYWSSNGSPASAISLDSGYFGSTNLYSVRIPTDIYLFDRGIYDSFDGDTSKLQKLNLENVNIGVLYYMYGPTIYICNEQPGYLAGIEDIQFSNANAVGKIYSVTGQRLNAPVKGINIIGGKKVLMK